MNNKDKYASLSKYTACELQSSTFNWWKTIFIPWLASISVEKGGVGNCLIPQHPMTSIPMGRRIKARIPVEKSYNFQLGNRQGTRNHLACSIAVPDPWQLPHWKLCNFSTGMSSCYNIDDECIIKRARLAQIDILVQYNSEKLKRIWSIILQGEYTDNSSVTIFNK